MSEQWKDLLIRAVLIILGVWILFFTPAFLRGHLLAKIGGTLACLSGILGPHRMGVLNTAIILTLVYALAVGPMRFFAWIKRDDALGLRPLGNSFWRRRRDADRVAESALSEDEQRRLRFQF